MQLARDAFIAMPDEINHRSLELFIRNDPNYSGNSIRLLSCVSGADSKGSAQNLPNKLGVEIMSP